MTDVRRTTNDQGSSRTEELRDAIPVDTRVISQVATAADVAPPEGSALVTDTAIGEDVRRRLRWGPQYFPEIDHREERRRFSQICQRVLVELDELEASEYLVGGRVSDEGAGVLAEIASLLETLFDCPFGEKESLKSAVVAIQSQTNNADWTQDTVGFLRDVMVFLRARYVVNDQTVNEVYEIIKEHGLDPFRGSVSDRGIKTRYRLVKVDDP